MSDAEAARQILNGVRRNYAEFSVPGYLFYFGHILRYFHNSLKFMFMKYQMSNAINFLYFQSSSKESIFYVTRFVRFWS